MIDPLSFIAGQPFSCILWASYQIRKIAGCACSGNAEKVFPRRRFQRKPLVSDPGMHHGTCVTHVPWCMSGSLTCGDGENVPGIPRACVPAILRIWQEAHGLVPSYGQFIMLIHTGSIIYIRTQELKPRGFSFIVSLRTHDTITTPLLRRNEVAT